MPLFIKNKSIKVIELRPGTSVVSYIKSIPSFMELYNLSRQANIKQIITNQLLTIIVIQAEIARCNKYMLWGRRNGSLECNNGNYQDIVNNNGSRSLPGEDIFLKHEWLDMKKQNL